MRRKRWRHAPSLPCIGADALAAPTHNPLAQQILDDLGGRPRRMRPGLIGVQKQIGIVGAGIPVAAQNHPLTSVDWAVFCLPFLHMLHGQQEIGVGITLARKIEHVDRGHQSLHRQRIRVAIGIILARNPMVRRIKMSSRMFAHL